MKYTTCHFLLSLVTTITMNLYSSIGLAAPVLQPDSTVLPQAIVQLVKSPNHCQGIYGIKTTQKVVALTFDDGPNRIYTPRILKILKKYGISATFFVTGQNVREYSRLIIRLYLQGHQIANHTFSHRNLATLVERQVINEIEGCNEAIFKILGIYPIFFRPPYGACSKTTRKVVEKMGLVPVLWSSTANDFQVDLTSPEKIAADVISLVKPGAIILLHDGGGVTRQKTVDALKIIITTLQEQGYEFLTIAQLLNAEPYF